MALLAPQDGKDKIEIKKIKYDNVTNDDLAPILRRS